MTKITNITLRAAPVPAPTSTSISTPTLMTHHSLRNLINAHRPNLKPYEAIRKHLHSRPELSQQEAKTAAFVVSHLRPLEVFKIHEKIGGHGVAAVFENGDGKTVLLRADMDALPVEEKTGLSYASTVRMKDYDGIVKPVMHACGHDIHVTCLLAAAECLINMRDSWSGTLILVFQPAEERGGGAMSMVMDGLYEKVPIPDVVLGQHVMPLRAGQIGTRVGPMMAATDGFKVTLYGRGGHASQPENTVDPVVMAASTVMRLQTIVSREVASGAETAVVTVGSMQAGQTENIIADTAELKINVRTFDLKTRDKVLASIKRIIKAESDASGATQEPLIEAVTSFPATVNDEATTTALQETFGLFFETDFDPETPRINGSEDFSYLGTSVGKPCTFWKIGGTDPDAWDEAEKKGTLGTDIPTNHSAQFAPVMHPTLEVGMDALTLAAMTFMGKAWRMC